MFEEYRFGMVKFGNEKYQHDIVVYVNGKIEKRDKNPSRRKYGTSHVLCAEEIQDLLDEEPEVLVVGSGQSGILRVGEDARKLLSVKNVELVDLPTQKAIVKFNNLKDMGRKVAAVIHVTC